MLQPDLVLRSNRVITPRGTRPGAIHIRHGRIVGILDIDDVPAGCPIEDVHDAAIMPGLVDPHVRVAGAFESVTRAAAAGGVTTIIDMPSDPATAPATAPALETLRQRANGRCLVDVGFCGGVDSGVQKDVEGLADAGVFGFSCGLVPERHLRMAMSILARRKSMLLVRAERAITALSQLCREYRTQAHVIDLSLVDALTPLYKARAERLPITAQTNPSHLVIVRREDQRARREFLWAAVANRLIHTIASSHGDGGTPLERSLATVWTEARARGYTLEHIAEWMCRAPAQLLGLSRKGVIDVGYEADLIVFDSEHEMRAFPYLGVPLRGRVERTYLRGLKVYDRRDTRPPLWSGRLLVRS